MDCCQHQVSHLHKHRQTTDCKIHDLLRREKIVLFTVEFSWEWHRELEIWRKPLILGELSSYTCREDPGDSDIMPSWMTVLEIRSKYLSQEDMGTVERSIHSGLSKMRESRQKLIKHFLD